MSAKGYRFDLAYQQRLVGACFRLDNYMRTVYDCVKPEWFTQESLGRLIYLCKLFYDTYRVSPTPLAIRTAMNDLLAGNTLSDAQAEQLRQTFELCCTIDLTEAHDIKNRVAQFAKKQAMLTALIESADLLDAEDYEGVLRRVESARKVGLREDLGLSFFHDDRPPVKVRERVPTGLPTLDSRLRGGPGRGDGCVVVAPSGVGKSWYLMSMGLSAVEAGWDAVYYTLELSEITADERVHMMTGTWRTHEDDRRAARAQLYERLRSNFHIQFFPGGTVSVADLRRHFDNLCAEGKVRRERTLILVDYGELLRPSTVFSEGYQTARQKYFELATWAQEDQLVVWTAQQTGREGDSAHRVTKDMIGDSWKIVCDYRVVVTLTSGRKDRQDRRAFLLLDKATDSDGVDGVEVELTWHEGCRRMFENRGSAALPPPQPAPKPATKRAARRITL